MVKTILILPTYLRTCMKLQCTPVFIKVDNKLSAHV